jgi:hypothetical protein
MKSKTKISDFVSFGSCIGMCAAVGVVLGAMLGNVSLWLSAGAGVGVVLGAVVETQKKNKGS